MLIDKHEAGVLDDLIDGGQTKAEALRNHLIGSGLCDEAARVRREKGVRGEEKEERRKKREGRKEIGKRRDRKGKSREVRGKIIKKISILKKEERRNGRRKERYERRKV